MAVREITIVAKDRDCVNRIFLEVATVARCACSRSKRGGKARHSWRRSSCRSAPDRWCQWAGSRRPVLWCGSIVGIGRRFLYAHWPFRTAIPIRPEASGTKRIRKLESSK